MITKDGSFVPKKTYPNPVTGVCCPRCRSSDVKFSEMVRFKPFYRRMVFSYHKCQLCTARFKRNRFSWCYPLIWGASLATILNIVMTKFI